MAFLDRELTRAPVIWSHSASRHYNNISRNVPDYILKRIGSGKDQVDGVVMVNIYPAFMLPTDKQEEADVTTAADHVEWMAGIMGKKQCVMSDATFFRRQGAADQGPLRV